MVKKTPVRSLHGQSEESLDAPWKHRRTRRDTEDACEGACAWYAGTHEWLCLGKACRKGGAGRVKERKKKTTLNTWRNSTSPSVFASTDSFLSTTREEDRTTFLHEEQSMKVHTASCPGCLYTSLSRSQWTPTSSLMLLPHPTD